MNIFLSRGIQLIYLLLLLFFIVYETLLEKGGCIYFFTHLAPIAIVAIPFFISFKQPKIAGWLNLSIVGLYCFLSVGIFHWSTYFLIGGPLVISGVLFLIPSKTS